MSIPNGKKFPYPRFLPVFIEPSLVSLILIIYLFYPLSIIHKHLLWLNHELIMTLSPSGMIRYDYEQRYGVISINQLRTLFGIDGYEADLLELVSSGSGKVDFVIVGFALPGGLKELLRAGFT